MIGFAVGEFPWLTVEGVLLRWFFRFEKIAVELLRQFSRFEYSAV